MLSVWEAIQMRRSIRKFAPDDVPAEIIERVLEAARLAPSASNRQPWRFLVVRDQEVKQELRRIRSGQQFIEEAPVLIVCFGDLARYSVVAAKQRRQELIDSGVAATISSRFADPRYLAQLDAQPTPPREQLLTPVIANTYIAIEHLLLMATALGVGTCWLGLSSSASEINRLFDLGDNLIPIALILVGYPAGGFPPPRPRLPLEEILLKPLAQPVS